MPPSAERARNWLVVSGIALAIGTAIIAYPYVLDAVLERFGVRAVASALAGLAALSLALPGRTSVRAVALEAAPVLGFPVLLMLAAVTNEQIYLRLVPALVYLTLAGIFASSLRAPDSLIERGARYLVPAIPLFIRSYCRKVTGVWVAFFAASALMIAALAVADLPDWWRATSGGLIYACMIGITVVEFFVRKTWFRYYYHDGLFDRLWSRIFPAENTARGRASLDYIQRHRDALRSRAR
ncbi:MAG: hypothetical protein OEM49_08605 [Myxococcales bacterium]|nr:hypothetical protein [Myxococcales bacterium]MDH5565288.1 hypothetical protein [Myxococcales bacterium]